MLTFQETVSIAKRFEVRPMAGDGLFCQRNIVFGIRIRGICEFCVRKWSHILTLNSVSLTMCEIYHICSYLTAALEKYVFLM